MLRVTKEAVTGNDEKTGRGRVKVKSEGNPNTCCLTRKQ